MIVNVVVRAKGYTFTGVYPGVPPTRGEVTMDIDAQTLDNIGKAALKLVVENARPWPKRLISTPPIIVLDARGRRLGTVKFTVTRKNIIL